MRTTDPCARDVMFAALAGLVALVPAGSAAAPQLDAESQTLLAIQALDKRVATVAHRLAISAGDLCADQTHLPGLSVHSRESYLRGYADRAAALFGVDRGPAVLAIAGGSAAERAGLRHNDVIVAIDGAPPLMDEGRGTSGVTVLSGQIYAAASDGVLRLDVLRAGAATTIEFRPDAGCVSRVTMRPDSRIDAAADGSIVQVTSALVEYAGDDAGLATVIAHELAHNILRHRVRLREAGATRGGFAAGFGRSGRLSREAEIEADRLGVRLMARAGYDPAAALRFWEAFRRDHGRGIFRSGTHPSERARIAAVESEIAAIAAEKRKAVAREDNPADQK